MSISAGPAVLDVEGFALADEERRRLRHPAAGGVILFSRNFRDSVQLAALVGEIRALRPGLLICVDHEGGRVQRFRDGFFALPAMSRIGALWDRDRALATDAARACGVVIGAELAAHGLDFSFAPVLDLDYGSSAVIGDRAFHSDPLAVGQMGAAFIRGLASMGMAAVGKHFPGHGYAAADSHVDVPRDERTVRDIIERDLLPYRLAIEAGLAGVMPAHVVYPRADARPAGYSGYWLREILRGRLGFDGMVFSDDLSMKGASTEGGIAERARAALGAGCDMVLLCNDPAGQEGLLESLAGTPPVAPARLARMRARRQGRALLEVAEYRSARSSLEEFAPGTA